MTKELLEQLSTNQSLTEGIKDGVPFRLKIMTDLSDQMKEVQDAYIQVLIECNYEGIADLYAKQKNDPKNDAIKDEIKGVVRLIDEVYKTFGFKYSIELSTMPEDHVGELDAWEMATNGLREAIEELGYDYEVNEGDGAFYGPKLDFKLEDSLGRTWQCGTIQLDFQLPERFELEYIGADGEKHRPVMIHRVVFGSIERFIGVITEHFAGAFPTWLAPVQVKVLPISDKYADYAHKVFEELGAAGLKVEIDERAEKIGYKIREARNMRIPFILVVGEKEEAEGTVSVRSRKGEEGAQVLNDFIARVKNEVNTKYNYLLDQTEEK